MGTPPLEIRASFLIVKKEQDRLLHVSCTPELQNTFISEKSNNYELFNSLLPGVAFLYPLKTSENLKVF